MQQHENMTNESTDIRITYVLQSGENRTVSCAPGTSVMHAALQNGVPGIIAECGGACACATCHVYVDEAFVEKLSEVGDFENDMLENVAAGRQPNSRLSCQIRLTPELSGLSVAVPEQM